MKMYETHEKGGEYYRTRRSKKIKFYSVGGKDEGKNQTTGEGKNIYNNFCSRRF